MRLQRLSSARFLRGRRVLYRADLNIALRDGRFEASDTWKLRSIVPTLKFLTRKGAKIIMVSSRGRPRGVDHDLSLRPIVRKLSHMVGLQIPLWKEGLVHCAELSETISRGSIVCLENIRFHHGESENDPYFAKQLAACGDLFVNDAFANIHRSHASMVGVTRFLPSYAGLLMEREIGHLYDLLHTAEKPIVAIIGGSKISTKILLIKKLLRKVDWLLMGGALANNVLAAMNYRIGRSMIEPDMISWSKGILHNKLKVPLDAVVAHSPRARLTRIAAIGAVRNKEMILDIGPETSRFYAEIAARAKTVIWNGPLGYFEDPRFGKATRQMVRALAKAHNRSYIGGGETVKAVLAARAQERIYFLSTGGGAMLTLLEGRPLPALRALVRT